MTAHIVVGAVVAKDDKFLLVQEAQPSCYGQWNLPAGHLEAQESLFEGAKREIKEESNCDVELTGICQIGNRKRVEDTFIGVIFVAEPTSFDIQPQAGEILDVKWFTYDEILALGNQIRNTDLLLGALDNYRKGLIAPLDLIKLYHAGAEFQDVTIQEDAVSENSAA